MDQKARNKRVHTKLPLTWRATFNSTIFNVSRGGLYFRCANPPRVGDLLELDFSLPDSTIAIRASGVVRWVSSNSISPEMDNLFGVGLEFEKIADEGTQALETFIAKQLESNTQVDREHRRLPVRVVVDYMFSGENYRTIANDISRRGMFLVSTEPLDLDDMLHMKFRLPNVEALIKARGIVRWRHTAIPETLSNVITPGMGVEFTDISEEDLQLVAQFIQSQNQS